MEEKKRKGIWEGEEEYRRGTGRKVKIKLRDRIREGMGTVFSPLNLKSWLQPCSDCDSVAKQRIQQPLVVAIIICNRFST